MPKKTAVPEKPVNPRKKGLEKVTFRLEPSQIVALQKEALRRAVQVGSMKPDASEIIRELVNRWLKERR